MTILRFWGKHFLCLLLVFCLAFPAALVAAAKEATPESGSAEFTGFCVSLESDLSVHVYAKVPGEHTVTIQASIEGNTDVTLAGRLMPTGEYHFVYTGITPQRIGDTVAFTLLSDGEAVATESFSVRSYLRRLLDATDESLGLSVERGRAMRTFIADLLAWGGAAQTYTGYHTDDLVSETPLPDGIAPSTFVHLPASESVKAAWSMDDGYAFLNATLLFDWCNRLRLRFRATNTEGLTLSLKRGDGLSVATEITEEADGVYTCLSVPLCAVDVDTVLTATLSKDGKAVAQCSYSVTSYVVSMQDCEDPAMRALARTTYLVGKSAMAYALIGGEVPTATTELLYINPRALEVYPGLPLQLNLRSTEAGYAYSTAETLAQQGQAVIWRSSDPAVAKVSEDGTVTGVAIGTAKVWATVRGADVGNIKDGDVVASVTVTVVDKPEYLKLAERDERQKITLGATTSPRITLSDFTSMPAGSYGAANIALWQGDRDAVFTMTVDDNLMGDFENWNTLSATYGIPITFMAPTQTYHETGVTWRRQCLAGQTVQSHGHYHLASGEYKTINSALAWMDFYVGVKEINAVGAAPSRIIGYPCGYNDPSLSSLLYIAGRGTVAAINDADSINYNYTNSFSGFPTDTEAMISELFGKWMSVHYHGMGDSYNRLSSVFSAISAQNNIWTTTFVLAAQYGQERDTATLTVKSAEENTVVLNVTDEMNDLLFDCPLTVKVLVDSTWQHARAYQNGKEVSAEVVSKDGATYLMVEAVPDRGDVTVYRTAVTGESVTKSRIAYTPVATDGTTGAYTRTFTVDGDVWQYAYAMQDGKKIPATLATYGGVTTLSVTAQIGGGEVTVVPLTDQYASRTTYTMTEIYGREMPPDAAKNITISSAEELRLFSAYVNADNTCEGLTFVLTQDIDLTDTGDFDPIGWELIYEKSTANYYYHPFSGTLDGAGYTIRGLSVNRVMCNAGLFGYTKNATVRNLNVSGNVSGIKRTGGVIGMMEGGAMDNVNFTGTVASHGVAGAKRTGSYTGGIIGQSHGVTVTNVTFRGSVTSEGANARGILIEGFAEDVEIGCYTGGIIGHSYTAHTAMYSTVSNVAVWGAVNATAAPDGRGGKFVGGIVGGGSSISLTDAYAYVNVGGASYVGGIAGYAEGENREFKITNCAAEGTAGGTSYVGGIAGGVGTCNRAKVKNCFTAVTVTAPVGAEYIGAVIGVVIGGNNNPKPENVYYLASVAENLSPTNFRQDKNVIPTADLISVGTAEEALAFLNDLAAKEGNLPWRMTATGGLTAAHVPVFTVTFLDKNGDTISTVTVGDGLAATAPDVPEVPGWRFVGWDADFSSVSENLTVHARYEEVITHTVTFLGKDGETLATVTVNDGMAATAPTAPVLPGFLFDHWDTAFDAVTSDLTVRAVYVIAYTVRFFAVSGEETLLSTVQVAAGKAAIAPDNPSREGYRFTGWEKDFSAVNADMDVYATWQAVAEGPTDVRVVKIRLDVTGNRNTCLSDSEFAGWLASLSGADVAFYQGSQAVDLPGGAEETWGQVNYTTPRTNNGGLGYAVLWRKDVYEQTGEALADLPNTDAGYIAVPLTEKTTGRKIVFVSFYLGVNAKTNYLIKNYLPKMFTSMTAAFPDAEAYVFGMHTATNQKGGNNTGLTDTVNAWGTTTSFLEGWTFRCLAESDDTTKTPPRADYVFTYAPTGAASAVTTGTTHTVDGCAGSAGAAVTVRIQDET